MTTRCTKVLVVLAALVLMAGPVFGEAILGPNDVIIAVDADGIVSAGSHPAAEAPANILDGNPATKYLNGGGSGSGFIVTPAIPFMVQSFTLTTANDAATRDPATWELYGTNDAIVTAENGDGRTENWTLICGGTLALPAERFTDGPLYVVANQAEAYTSYKVLFPTVKNAAAANSMQIAEIQLFGAVVVPEPVVEVPAQ